MPADFTRIFSDVHFGDRSSQVHRLAQLQPLVQGAASLVLNGDTLDTRSGPNPELTATMRAEVLAFFPQQAPKVTFLTGNHDADLTPHHLLQLANGRVFVTHGDILYDDLVPWSQDAPFIQSRLTEEFAALLPSQREELETRLAVFRRVANKIPQRHQSERNPLKYAVHFAQDTIWPPSRLFRILRSWQQMPGLAATLLRKYQPQAGFILIGHTHRPGVWRRSDGTVVVNTGSFSRPFGGCVVDLFPDRLVVRRIRQRNGEFHTGAVVAEFALAES